MRENKFSVSDVGSGLAIPRGFGVRQSSVALAAPGLRGKSGRGLPQSKTLARGLIAPICLMDNFTRGRRSATVLKASRSNAVGKMRANLKLDALRLVLRTQPRSGAILPLCGGRVLE